MEHIVEFHDDYCIINVLGYTMYAEKRPEYLQKITQMYSDVLVYSHGDFVAVDIHSKALKASFSRSCRYFRDGGYYELKIIDKEKTIDNIVFMTIADAHRILDDCNALINDIVHVEHPTDEVLSLKKELQELYDNGILYAKAIAMSRETCMNRMMMKKLKK